MRIPWLFAFAAACLFAAGPEFEVTSVKPSANTGGFGPFAGGAPTVQMGPASGGRFVSKNLPVRAVILMAYGIQDYQLSGGPAWISTERFDIEGRPEAGAKPTEADVRLMLQALLAERFGLKVRRETKAGPVYKLTVEKAGKLKASADQTPVVVEEGPAGMLDTINTIMNLGMGPGAGMMPPPGAMMAGGGPPPGMPPGGPGGPMGGGGGRGGPGLPPGMSMDELKRGSVFNGPGMLRGKAIAVDALVKPLTGEVRKPVTNATGLKGLFDVEMNWVPAQMAEMLEKLPPGVPLPPGISADGPDVFRALREQLGLKLETAQGPVEAIVIESIAKPTEN